MSQVFLWLGIVCVVGVVLLSLTMHWYVKKYADQTLERVSQFVMCGALARTVMSIFGAVFFILSNVISQ